MNRRSVLVGAMAAAGTAVATGLSGAPAQAATLPADPAAGDVVLPADPRYPDLMTGNNKRFVATPEYIKMIRSSADAEQAVTDAVRAGKRVSVRSGGHCFADFTCNPDVEVILDLSELTGVSYDPAMRAFAVEPGARLLNVYEALFKGWNVTIPGGICYSVGVGGHIAGGGYGLLSRAHGLTIDHLYAVEVVVVDAHLRVRTVVATKEANDPRRDLWWAHAGGGGGNFGVVTKYWFRSPGATGDHPSAQLVAPPSTVLVSAIEFPWEQLAETSFIRLLNNFGRWHEANSAPDSPYTSLSSLFNVSHKAHGSLGMFTQVDAGAPNAAGMLDDYLAAMTDGTGVTPQAASGPMGELRHLPDLLKPQEYSWLQATRLVGTNNPTITSPTSRGGHKSAYMRRNFSPAQISALYKYMSGADGSGFDNPDTMLVLFSFGGQVNAVADDATANAQREAVFKMCFQTFWPNASDDSFYLGWLRRLYGEFFADTGGVPVPGTSADGCYINYADVDMSDPAFNKSGVPWSTLYYKDNYPRLQQVKRTWDPTNFFRHHMSVEPS
ncbi:MAG TPA: FAD-binding protein [Pseudonocardiaceae bacterium]|nr:FAD-binding protein [Pseudonocardiaceae bacterium]